MSPWGMNEKLYMKYFIYWRGSPTGFSGSGIWLISRPGVGILKENGDEIRDCYCDRDTGFGDFNKWESGNVALKRPRFGNSRDWNMQRKSCCRHRNSRTMTWSTSTFSTTLSHCPVTPMVIYGLFSWTLAVMTIQFHNLFFLESYNTVRRTLCTDASKSLQWLTEKHKKEGHHLERFRTLSQLFKESRNSFLFEI